MTDHTLPAAPAALRGRRRRPVPAGPGQFLVWAAVAVLTIAPLTPLVITSLRSKPYYLPGGVFTASAYSQLLADPAFRQAALNTAIFALSATALAVVLGAAFAVLGQQQRVALARALAHGPTALLLDEPFSNLDARLRDRAREWLGRLQREFGMTTVFVTHDQTEALAMSDQILVMNGGRIVRAGPPEEVYRHPGSRFAAQFLGRCNFLTGTARRIADGEYVLEATDLPGAVRFHAQAAPPPVLATVAVRPESLLLSEPTAGNDGGDASGACWPAQVVHTTFLGDHYLHTLRAGAQVLEAVSTRPLATAAVQITIDETAASLVTDDEAEFDNVL